MNSMWNCNFCNRWCSHVSVRRNVNGFVLCDRCGYCECGKPGCWRTRVALDINRVRRESAQSGAVFDCSNPRYVAYIHRPCVECGMWCGHTEQRYTLYPAPIKRCPLCKKCLHSNFRTTVCRMIYRGEEKTVRVHTDCAACVRCGVMSVMEKTSNIVLQCKPSFPFEEPTYYVMCVRCVPCAVCGESHKTRRVNSNRFIGTKRTVWVHDACKRRVRLTEEVHAVSDAGVMTDDDLRRARECWAKRVPVCDPGQVWPLDQQECLSEQ